jgi:hypothetical protein
MTKRETENSQTSNDPMAEMKRALDELEQALNETLSTYPKTLAPRRRR